MGYERFYQFIKDEAGIKVDASRLDLKIEKDFNIYGDEAEDFLIKFSKEFNVDIAAFNFDEHFNPESDKISRFISNIFKKKTRKDLTIRDLIRAINEGKLV